MFLRKYENYTGEQYWRRLRAGISSELRTYRKPEIGRPKQRFIIFAQGRTGSTLLTKYLDASSDVCCDREIFYYPRLFPYAYAEKLARTSGAHVYGFKVKIYQVNGLVRVDPAAFLDHMEEKGWKIIYLFRENVVKHAFSSFFAVKAKQYHFSPSEGEKDISFEVDPEKFLKLCRSRRETQAWEGRVLAGRKVLRLNYEQDLAAEASFSSRTLPRLSQFLDTQLSRSNEPLAKSVHRAPAHFLQNADDV